MPTSHTPSDWFWEKADGEKRVLFHNFRFWTERKSTVWLVLETTLTKCFLFVFFMFSNHPSLHLTSWCPLWNDRLLKKQLLLTEIIITWPFKITFSMILMADILFSVHYFIFYFISKTSVIQLLTTVPIVPCQWDT